MFIKKVLYRTYQKMMFTLSLLVKFPIPQEIKGDNAIVNMVGIIKSKNYKGVLVVSDQTISKLGLLDFMLHELKKANIKYELFDRTRENPPFDDVYEALSIYKENNLNALIALGGGSSMDLAKAVGALVVRPKKKLNNLRGLFKVRRRLPDLYCIPTTAGSGSEATLTAVVTDLKTKRKFTINDPVLIPKYAVFDSKLLMSLPSRIIATTGMDALTHAVEAYIGHSNTKSTKRYAKEAVILIKKSLIDFYNTKSPLAIANMQEASFKAGLAFRKAYVGYIHALAHPLGGMYEIQHGYANAILMPHILKFYGKKAYKKLSELSDLLELTTKDKSKMIKAEAFIQWIENMNKELGIPDKFYFKMNDDDIRTMAMFAFKEANPLYPVPKIMTLDDIITLYKEISE